MGAILTVSPGVADPFRLVVFWTIAEAEVLAHAHAEEQRWRKAVDEQLGGAGVFRRVLAANAAIATPTFAAAMNAATEERRAARDENDLAAICRRILVGMGVDMTDVLIRLRRARESELTRAERRTGIAQLRLSAKPTVDSAQRAIDAAAAAGFRQPSAVAAAAWTEQTGQSTSDG